MKFIVCVCFLFSFLGFSFIDLLFVSAQLQHFASAQLESSILWAFLVRVLLLISMLVSSCLRALCSFICFRCGPASTYFVPLVFLPYFTELQVDARHRYGHNLHQYYLHWINCDTHEPFFYWYSSKPTDPYGTWYRL